MSTPAHSPDPHRQLLRHTIATLAYRAGKAIRDTPADAAAFRPSADSRNATEILAHMGDLFDWSLSMAKGEQAWRNSSPLPWDAEVARFFTALETFDAYLASSEPMHAPAEKLFQGPIADALTHTGQLTMLRRLAGAPLRGENFYVADVAIGRVGSEQSAPVREF